MCFFFCFIGMKMSVDGVLRGGGDMQMFTIANLVNLGLRVSLAMALAPASASPSSGTSSPWAGWPISCFLAGNIGEESGRERKWIRRSDE